MHRRTFVQRSLAAGAALGTAAWLDAQTAAASPSAAPATPPDPKRVAAPDRGPQLDAALVKEFVVAGHANIPRVKELLAGQPALINASWDWGRGDFESAINGASHIGRRDVALYLLEAGARLDAPCAAMLGETDMLTALIRLSPSSANVRGAHGFSLLYHAAYSGKLAIAESLSPHLTTRARDCNQALQVASMVGHAEFVAWLLKNGVDNPNTKNFQGKTPLDLATERDRKEIAELLRAAGGISGK